MTVETSPTTRSWKLLSTRNVALQSENVFRLGGADDEAGVNDYLYCVGLNRIVQSDWFRIGTGVKSVSVFYLCQA